MSLNKKWSGILLGVFSLFIIKGINPVVGYIAPQEELGDFTLYNHGEISKYNGYRGMLVSMYRIPADVGVGTLMIKVKPAPDGCSPKRQIHVHLQAGSLPLVNALKESFPPDFILSRFSSQHRLQVANDGSDHYLNVTHPVPGQWFLIAYYIDKDTSIKQEGLTVSCHSILIVGLQFRFLRRIPQLIFDEEDPVDDHLYFDMKPKRKTYLFKFFVPQSVISYSISVLNCTSSSADNDDDRYYCPLTLSTRAHAFPFSNYQYYNATTSSSSIGINDELPMLKSCGDSHLVLDSKNQTLCSLVNEYPVRGAWHYLNISRTDKESANATISFALRAASQDCFHLFPVLDQDKNGIPKPHKTNDTSRLDDDDDVDANGNETTTIATTRTTMMPSTLTTDLDDLSSSLNSSVDSLLNASSTASENSVQFLFCPDRVEPLFKTEKEEHFQFSFYPLKEIAISASSKILGYSCPGLCLRDAEVYFYSLTVDPRDDIGGTIKIFLSFHSRSDILQTKAGQSQKRVVTACMTKDSTLLRSGNLVNEAENNNNDDNNTCSRGYRFQLDSEDDSKLEVTKWIPYPEPGSYFIKLSVRCVGIESGNYEECAPIYIFSTRRTFKGEVLQINVSSNACIEGECGPYGTCAIAYFNKIQYSYCVCDKALGYQGYGCTELGPDAPSQIVLVLNVVFLVGSNVAFLGAIVLAIRRGFYLEAIVYFGVLFFSTFYHACDQPLYFFCLIKGSSRRSYDLLQFMDFVTALFALWVTILAVAEFPFRFKLPMVTLGAILVPAMTYYNRFLLQTILVPLGVSIGITVISWIVKCRRSRRCFPRQHYSVLHILPGFICGLSGIICFTQATEQNYYIIHSLWHVLMATAIACLLPCANKAGRSVDSNMQTDDDDDDEDDVCHRIITTGGNNDTDSSTASANGNGIGIGNGNSAPRALASFLFPPRNHNSRNNIGHDVNAQTSSGSVAPINGKATTPTPAENPSFERPASSRPASMTGLQAAPPAGQSASANNYLSLNTGQSTSSHNHLAPSTSQHSAASMLGSMLSREEDSS